MRKYNVDHDGLGGAYLLSDNGVPIYAGSGSNKRAMDNKPKQKDVNDLIKLRLSEGNPITREWFPFPTRKEYKAKENELIEKYGRLDLGTGTLLNRNGTFDALPDSCRDKNGLTRQQSNKLANPNYLEVASLYKQMYWEKNRDSLKEYNIKRFARIAAGIPSEKESRAIQLNALFVL